MDANNKSITLDDLAVIVSKGFNGMNGRLDKVEGEMSSLIDRNAGLAPRNAGFTLQR